MAQIAPVVSISAADVNKGNVRYILSGETLHRSSRLLSDL